MSDEALLESYFNRRAALLGCGSFKFVSPNYSGVGDRIVVGFSMTWYAELKAPGKRPRKRQLFVHKEWKRKYDITIHVLDSKVTIDAFFKLVQYDIQTARLSAFRGTADL